MALVNVGRVTSGTEYVAVTSAGRDALVKLIKALIPQWQMGIEAKAALVELDNAPIIDHIQWRTLPAKLAFRPLLVETTRIIASHPNLGVKPVELGGHGCATLEQMQAYLDLYEATVPRVNPDYAKLTLVDDGEIHEYNEGL